MLKTKLKYALGIATSGLTATTIIWARKQYKKMLSNKVDINSFDITDCTDFRSVIYILSVSFWNLA
jgi:hypothetical protein